MHYLMKGNEGHNHCQSALGIDTLILKLATSTYALAVINHEQEL
jgi:hypothetical protein